MCSKKTCLISFVFLLVFVGAGTAQDGDPNLVGWWKLDDGEGTVAIDSSGYGNDGALMNGPAWVAGKIGGALEFDGANDYVDCGNAAVFDITEQITLAVWVNTSDMGNGEHNPYIAKSDHAYAIKGHQWGNIEFFVYDGGWRNASVPADESFNGVWHHLAGTFDGTALKLYVDGELRFTTPYVGSIETRTHSVYLAANAERSDRFYDGLIDDARIYDRALSAVEISRLVHPELAAVLTPEDGSIISEAEIQLQWGTGLYADAHDVYLGEDFDDVNSATVGTVDIYRGRQAGTQYPEDGPMVVEFGKTYYWRIDEVNEPDIWAGKVWSFTVLGDTAVNPNPPDGARYVEPNVVLSWTPGKDKLLHRVYLGENFDDVQAGTGDTRKTTTGNTTYSPTDLEFNKTYYWKIGELDSSLVEYPGEVWSFTTIPETPITDPNLVGWWKLDDGEGDIALDWSGQGNHGTVIGNPQWVSGQLDGGLDLDGYDDCIDVGDPNILGITEAITLSAWVKTDTAANSGEQSYITKGNDSYALRHSVDNNIEFRISETVNVLSPIDSTFNGIWHHLAGTYDGSQLKLYIDGALRGTTNSQGTIATSAYSVSIGRESVGNRFLYEGVIDDARIYNRALTQQEIVLQMRGDPLLAWNASPASGSLLDIEQAGPISWTPGDQAAEQDVYFGTDGIAVSDANSSDTTGIYRGTQDANTYTPPEGIEWGQTYYWRIDQINTDETISTGRVWSFTIADYLTVDNFEAYNGIDNQIWLTWRDGIGFVFPYEYSGNGTGAEVGDLSTASRTEETIAHDGHSMPVVYDNNKPPDPQTQQTFLKYSEVQMTLDSGRDWTRRDVKGLVLWFRGYPAYVGSFTEGPVGTYTMTAAGADIWDQADEFHFAYKMLTGVGSIRARVLSVDNTDDWAKAGVMIRDTLEPGSKFAAVYITPGNGCRFHARLNTDTDAVSDTEVATEEQIQITAPYWVRLDRDISGDITCYYSSNGSDWQLMVWSPQNIQMSTTLYIGLALTSHNVDETCQAQFSNVTIEGNVSGDWMHQDIGILSNDVEPVYVAVANSTGAPAVVYYDDPNGAQIDDWTEWNIDLRDLEDQGIDLTDVNSIAIGLGDRDNPQAGGKGKMYFDDIRLYRLRCVPDMTLEADLDDDCMVDSRDLEVMAGDWLDSGDEIAADINADSTVDLKDYAVLADQWLDEQLWPEP